MLDGKKNTLAKIALFADLDDTTLALIEGACIWTKTVSGKVLVRQGDPSDTVYFITSGAVVAKSYSQDGKEVTFTDIPAGGICGEFAAIDQLPRSASIQTTKVSNIAQMPAETFRDLLRTTPALGFKMVEMLVKKNRALTERIYEFSTLTVRHRVCAELVRLAEKVGTKSNIVTIDPSPSQYQLSTRISTHREAVSREYSNLSAQGVIEVGRKKLTVLDLAELRKLAQLDPI